MMLCFPITYVFLKIGYQPYIITAIILLANIIIALIVLPILIIKIAAYNIKDVFMLYKKCLYVTIFSLPIPILINIFVNVSNTFIKLIIVSFFCLLSIILNIWYMGMNKKEKDSVRKYINIKFRMISKSNG